MDNHLDKDNYPNGEGALQQMFNRLNNLGFQGGEISQRESEWPRLCFHLPEDFEREFFFML